MSDLSVALHPNHDCRDAVQIATFIAFGRVEHEDDEFAILKKHGIPGAASTIRCGTSATRFWSWFSCVPTSWIPLQEVLTSTIVSLIGQQVTTRETMHECSSVEYWFSFVSFSIDMLIVCSRRVSSITATGLDSLGVTRPVF